MAPRIPESIGDFLARLDRQLAAGQTPVRFGRHHFSHAVCVEGERLVVRRLEHTVEEAEAYMREHGMFMPENAEAISQPRTEVHSANNREALGKWLSKRWPL